MFSGTTVTVETRKRPDGETTTTTGAQAGRDALGNEIVAYASPVSVHPVLIDGDTSNLDAARPEGVTITCTLHFPNTWTGDLRGARVTLPGRWAVANPYHVVGIPTPMMPENSPWLFPYNMTVEVEATYG